MLTCRSKKEACPNLSGRLLFNFQLISEELHGFLIDVAFGQFVQFGIGILFFL